jgi:hypothetical protein
MQSIHQHNKQMKTTTMVKSSVISALLAIGVWLGGAAAPAYAAGGATAGVRTDSVQVSKHFYVASNGTLLVDATSSSPAAQLYLYRPTGALMGAIRNNVGGKYGGTVFYVGRDPGVLIIKSSLGVGAIVPTIPYHP